jgi:hypothetical protein
MGSEVASLKQGGPSARKVNEQKEGKARGRKCAVDDMSMSVLVEKLTDELRTIVTYGATPERLLSCPILSDLSQVDYSLSEEGMGSFVRDYFIREIQFMTGTYVFQGESLDAPKLRWCLRILFEIEGEGQAPGARRARVHHILKPRSALGQFSRPHGPERKLLRLLAIHLVTRAEASQTNQVTAK